MSARRPHGRGAREPAGLVCPACSREHPAHERFCSHCGMPLVHAARGDASASARQRRARKIKPQYAEGELVTVARAQNETEAAFLEGLLLEEGIPCLLRRSRGFDVAEMLAAGPRDVLVPASGAQAAREALAWQAADPAEDDG